MASPPLHPDGSPYQEFVRNPNDKHDEVGKLSRTPMTMIYRDGSVLCETEDFRLLYHIVLHDDTLALKQYLTVAPWAVESMSARPEVDEAPREDGDYFLLAAQNGNLGVLQILLGHYKKELNSTHQIRFKKRGYQLLNEAARRGHVEMVQFLLDSQPLYAGIHERDCKGYTALASAADIYSVRYPDPADWRDVCVDNNEKVMDLLLDYGARASDVVLPMNDKEKTPDTVLTLAVQWAGSKLINRLIDGGADMQAKVTKLPFDLGFWNEHGYISDINALFIACISANFKAVQSLLGGSGVGVGHADMLSSRDSRGSLPIHWATRNQLPDELLHIPAPMLQERGADAGLRNKQGETPLHTLFRRDGTNVPVDAVAVSTLLAHGANATDADHAGNTPLHVACFNVNFSDAVSVLLQHGADPALRNSKQETPIHRVAHFNCPPSALRSKADEVMRVQDDMLDRLVKAGGAELMDLPNAAGKSTRQVYQDSRAKWLEGARGNGNRDTHVELKAVPTKRR
ncbi:hypothetical protein LZL87_008904 [Fusarium oxysporum]|nr:hypothetical protein LZL87_008904 [Fusarium oxysporum]